MTQRLSAQALSWKLGIPLGELKRVAHEANEHYRIVPLFDRSKDKVRMLKVPDEQLKTIQRRILRRLLAQHPLPEALHGGLGGRSPKTNAEHHLGKRLVVNLDIRHFFPSVDHRRVAEMFWREFGCGRDTTWLLTRLTTVDGSLPQGAPTSTMIGNLLLATPVDAPTIQRSTALGVTYTRFVDDMAFSGTHADELIHDTAVAVSRVSLSTWRKRKKLKITPRSRRQEVTGLTVNSANGPSVPRYKRDKIKAAIHQLRTVAAASFDREVQSIRGRVNHVRQTNPGAAKPLERKLNDVIQSRA